MFTFRMMSMFYNMDTTPDGGIVLSVTGLLWTEALVVLSRYNAIKGLQTHLSWKLHPVRYLSTLTTFCVATPSVRCVHCTEGSALLLLIFLLWVFCFFLHIYVSLTRQNCRHFADDIFKCIFLNKGIWISFKSSFKFVSMVRFNNIPALVLIMAWRRPGDKPLSGPMMVSLLTHICATRPRHIEGSERTSHAHTHAVSEQDRNISTTLAEINGSLQINPYIVSWNIETSNGSWCMGIKG